jgi:hypothetical protein
VEDCNFVISVIMNMEYQSVQHHTSVPSVGHLCALFTIFQSKVLIQ